MITNKTKIVITLIALSIAIYGFMLKLPSSLRGIDKQLHASFYFAASLFFNVLFNNKNILIHLAIVGSLFFLGFTIEHVQEYSNKLVGKTIHGRFDKEDIKWNVYGLIAFSLVWLSHFILSFFENFFFSKPKI
jgi:hypothetical protein